MAKLGDYLNATFTNAGISSDNVGLTQIIKDVAALDISDDLVEKFNSSFLTVEAAKNNPTIINHIKAQVYNGEDKNHKDIMDRYEFDDSMKAELLLEKSTPKRRELLIERIAELREKKAGASQGEKSTLTKQITDLNAELVRLKTSTVPKEKLDEVENSYKQRFNDMYLTSILSGHNYATDLAKEENYLLPKTKIQNALKEKNLRLKEDNNSLKLEQEDGTDYYENNVKIDFKSFSDRVLAQHKMLAASAPPTAPVKVHLPGTRTGPDNSKFMAAVDSLQAQTV